MKLDYTFERDGIPLSEWLWRLVDGDPPTRDLAGDRLMAMRMGLPRYDMGNEIPDEDPDFEAQRTRFEGAVNIALRDPGFDTATFLHRWSALRAALHINNLRQMIALRGSEASRAASRRNLGDIEARILRASKEAGDVARPARYCVEYLGTEVGKRTDACGLALSVLVDGIGSCWLAAPEALHFLLDIEGTRRDALNILAGIGADGVAFAARLLEEIDNYSGERPWGMDSEAWTLGIVGAGSVACVNAVLERVNHPAEPTRFAAVRALQRMDGELCGREREAVEGLFASTQQWEACCPVSVIASAGRHFSDVRAFVVEMALGNTAQWSSKTDPVVCVVDGSLGNSALAIDAMRYLTDYPDECVPVLIAVLDTFEEFDPDETYDGPHRRVVSALERFGEKGIDAVVPIARLLDQQKPEDDYPRAILKYLGNLGPLAGGALHYLEAYRASCADPEAPLADLTTERVDEFEDPVGWAIQRICGMEGE